MPAPDALDALILEQAAEAVIYASKAGVIEPVERRGRRDVRLLRL